MPEIGRPLVLLGALLVAVGLVVWWGPSTPWLGRLPGDVRIERPGFRFYFPVVTCVLASVVLSLLLRACSRWR